MTSQDDAISRRGFLERAGAAGLGAVIAGRLTQGAATPRHSPNEKVVVAVIGLNGRGMVHAQNFTRLARAEVAYLCDVDSTVLGKAMTATPQAHAPSAIVDFRRALDDKRVDAVAIAAPDHWHTPMAILALKAGKHVYLEKPCGHDAHEGELLVAAAARYGKHVQQGTQQRSAARTIQALQMVREGAIGAPYLVRAWYANSRGSIGRGKAAPVPPNLDYELWQGPAPRTPYRDNVVHYNWHWFTRWGTGEICNNGTHEIDIARLALGVDHPTSVTSTGGRYHFQDDWEFPDTQDVVFEFAGGKRIIWQGQSCNALKPFDRGRGTAIYGTAGSIILDRDGYVQYDVRQKIVKQSLEPKGNGTDLVGDDAATWQHMDNFLGAIRSGDALRAPIADGAKSVHLCHLGNIAQAVGRTLRVDPTSGRVVGDAQAMTRWAREYAPGWAPTA